MYSQNFGWIVWNLCHAGPLIHTLKLSTENVWTFINVFFISELS